MNLKAVIDRTKAILDRMYPKSAPNEQGVVVDERAARWERIDSQMHAAWADLLNSPVRVRSMDSWIFTPTTPSEKRIRLIVEHLVEAVTDSRDYHLVDVSSAKLGSDQDGAFISVLLLNLGWLTPFRVPSTAMLYINPPAVGTAMKLEA